jgi:hypothetical protein
LVAVGVGSGGVGGSSGSARVVNEARPGGRGRRGLTPLDVRIVDCRYCPEGCCGAKTIAVPSDLYDRLRLIRDALEEYQGVKGRLAMCRVINMLGDVLCQVLGYLPRRPIRVKDVERLISRDVLYKARYMVTRLKDAPDPRTAWLFIELAIQSWFSNMHRVLNVQPRGSWVDYAQGLLSGLGVKWGLRFSFAWVLANLLRSDLVEVEFKPGARVEVLAIRLKCPCGALPDVVPTSLPAPAVLVRLWRYLTCLGVRGIDDYWRLITRLRENGGKCRGIGG